MKILFASITDSGILRVRTELISELLAQGNSVIVATPQLTDYKELEKLGCKCVSVTIQQHGMNPFTDLTVYLQYIKILKEEKPDNVLLFTTKPNVYCGIACRRRNIPVVMNITGMGMALGSKGIIQRVLINLYKLACNGKNTKKIFFQNDDSKTFFQTHGIGNMNTYERIPGSGVNLEKFQYQKYPANSRTVDFLFIARIMKQKGIDQYLAAAKVIKQKHPETVFHVLGNCDDDYKEKLKKYHANGIIVYHGRVNNISDFQRMSQCTIQPSYYPEGMSNVILEAAATGRPVITTDHPGCREGVENGVTGYIIPKKNTNALINAIEEFLSLPINMREEMGMKGRKKMEQEFDRRIVTEAYVNIINEIKKEVLIKRKSNWL